MSTSQPREINSNKELTILRFRNVSRKNVEKSCTVWEQVPKSAFFLAEFIAYLPLIWPVVCVRNSRLRSRYAPVRNAHDIQEENLNDVDDQNSFILALQLHPLERSV